jgi:hypothetical protein
MPWKARCVMEEKLRFVFEYERDLEQIRDTTHSCVQFLRPIATSTRPKYH